MDNGFPSGEYDPSRVMQFIGGIEPKAYSPNARIAVLPTTPTRHFSRRQGQDGHIIRVKEPASQPPIIGTVTFTLMKTDPANDRLTELVGAEFVAYQLLDNAGKAKVLSEQCHVTEPEEGYSPQAETLSWTLQFTSVE
ncbi:hypothetical protein [Nannocystis punicea]|uniref:Uncharacterized protein n=1 Tax=Nannocystis punicea TaxID=2995304 RepID=A0ABY7HD45_9BACT|nr:hypothetical protein [Nannocystis poenicansa]WAS97211.1 hypothetical protein O0S08_13770 [Nannocystis poenicansa]